MSALSHLKDSPISQKLDHMMDVWLSALDSNKLSNDDNIHPCLSDPSLLRSKDNSTTTYGQSYFSLLKTS